MKIYVLCHNNDHPILRNYKANLTVGKLYECDNYDETYGWQYKNDLGERVDDINETFVHIVNKWELRDIKLKELGI